MNTNYYEERDNLRENILRPIMRQKRFIARHNDSRLGWIVSIIIGAIFWVLLLAWIAHADVVAEVIASEACGEGSQGLQAVANTIQNRSKAWHKTPLAIVTAKNQYYGLTNRHRHEIYMGCKRQADYLSTNIDRLPDLTHGAMYFLLPNEPRRAWHKEFLVKIGKHSFWR